MNIPSLLTKSVSGVQSLPILWMGNHCGIDESAHRILYCIRRVQIVSTTAASRFGTGPRTDSLGEGFSDQRSRICFGRESPRPKRFWRKRANRPRNVGAVANIVTGFRLIRCMGHLGSGTGHTSCGVKQRCPQTDRTRLWLLRKGQLALPFPGEKSLRITKYCPTREFPCAQSHPVALTSRVKAH